MKCSFVSILVFLTVVQLVRADDFKTVNGKEYKNAKISRGEPDGIVLITKSGVSKVYFTELPKEVQESFHYDPQKAAAAQTAAVDQAEEFNKQADEENKQRKAANKDLQSRIAEQRAIQAKQENIQALTDRLSELTQQEQNLLAEIGRIENAQTVARRKWVDGQTNQQYTAPEEAKLPLLNGQLENVRTEKERVTRELERAQHQS